MRYCANIGIVLRMKATLINISFNKKNKASPKKIGECKIINKSIKIKNKE